MEVEKIMEVQPVHTEHKEYASKGQGTAGVTLGTIGTVLGGYSLLRNGLGLFGNSRYGMPENVNINTTGGLTGTNPTAFQAWEKSCDDAIALTNAMWSQKVNTLERAASAREVDVSEKFGLWKSQVDADFGLYKSTRDNFDVLAQRISNLETKQAVSEAVAPYKEAIAKMSINNLRQDTYSAIALEAERRCCADNKIVNYMNNTFYPISVTDVTLGTTSTKRDTYNPLCGCCNDKMF